jgi:hypothetical protein
VDSSKIHHAAAPTNCNDDAPFWPLVGPSFFEEKLNYFIKPSHQEKKTKNIDSFRFLNSQHFLFA